MNKNIVIDMIQTMKRKTTVLKLKSHNKKDLILLMLYLYDWKFILVNGYSAMNINWRLINSKIMFIEYNSFFDESDYVDVGCIDKYNSMEIFKFIYSKLNKNNPYEDLLFLVNSTYPIASANVDRNVSLNLVKLAIEYKRGLRDIELRNVTSVKTSVFSKIDSWIQHQIHRLMNLNFKNTKYLELLIDNLKNEVNLYRYDFNTGLPTRHDMMLRLNLLEENHIDIAFIMYDINGLHEVNRLQGFEFGDILIKSVADDIIKLPGEHITYTTGGDEFFVIYEDIHQVPESIDVKSCCCEIVYSCNYNSFSDMISSVDSLVSAKKKFLKRRRDDI